ncbi:hypothetical protein ACFE04_019074 [Oxalis oulophora]
MGSDIQYSIPVIDFSLINSRRHSEELKDGTTCAREEFFELPSETKSKNLNLKPYHGYYDFQTDAISYEGESVTTMMKQMDEVYKAIEMMIIDSYGLEEKMCSIFDYKTLIRAMKYKPGKEIVGLKPHSDKVPSVIYPLRGSNLRT